MKLNILMIMIMSSGLLACQSQTAQLQQHSRIKLSLDQQQETLTALGYSGAKPEVISGYLAQNNNAQQRLQVKQLLKSQMQDDPSGEKELLYIANLMQVLDQEPSWTEETRLALWARQQRKGDVTYELISFYTRDPQQPDKDKLLQFIQQADKRLAPNQRFWLWAMVRLPNELKTQTSAVELSAVCQQVAMNTPAFGYVQPSNLQLCRRAQLIMARQQAGGDMTSLLADIQHDLQSARLQDSDLLPLMDILQSGAYGTPMNAQAISLGKLSGERDQAVELAVMALLLNQPGEQAETEHMTARLQQLRQSGNTQASVLLGKMYLDGQRKVADPVMAERMLAPVKALPEAAYLLGKLYLSGMLGKPPHVQEGVDLLVQSARSGYVKADESLADIFFDAPGVKANPVYAWVFASLALQQRPDSPREQRLLAALTLDGRSKHEAETLLLQERMARGVQGPVISPTILPQQRGQTVQQMPELPQVDDEESERSVSVSSL